MTLLLALACAQPGDATGRLTDALTRAPVAGASIHALPDAPTEACPELRATTDAAGRFTFAGLCRGVRYALLPDPAAWWLATPLSVDGGIALDGLDLTAWPLPPEDGVFLASRSGTGPAATVRVVSQARVDTVIPLAPGASPLDVPTAVPADLPAVGAGWLLVSQPDGAPPVELRPLVATERVTVGPVGAPRTLDPWFALGPARDPTPGTVVTGPSPLIDGVRAVRVLDGAALPAGAWAVADPGGRRAILVRFGDAAPTPE